MVGRVEKMEGVWVRDNYTSAGLDVSGLHICVREMNVYTVSALVISSLCLSETTELSPQGFTTLIENGVPCSAFPSLGHDSSVFTIG